MTTEVEKLRAELVVSRKALKKSDRLAADTLSSISGIRAQFDRGMAALKQELGGKLEAAESGRKLAERLSKDALTALSQFKVEADEEKATLQTRLQAALQDLDDTVLVMSQRQVGLVRDDDDWVANFGPLSLEIARGTLREVVQKVIVRNQLDVIVTTKPSGPPKATLTSEPEGVHLCGFPGQATGDGDE